MAKTAAKVGAMMAVVAGLIAASPVRAAAGEETAIVVRVENHAGIAAKWLVQAEEEAARVYTDAGIRTVWANDGASSPESGRAPHLTVLLLSPEMAKRLIAASSVANNVLGQAARRTTRAYIFYHRIEELVVGRHLNGSSILGQVMAHELGHLVLPVNSHSCAGIMRANLNLQEPLQRFTAEQANVIRTILTSNDRIAG